jgi:hypothetical protein
VGSELLALFEHGIIQLWAASTAAARSFVFWRSSRLAFWCTFAANERTIWFYEQHQAAGFELPEIYLMSVIPKLEAEAEASSK